MFSSLADFPVLVGLTLIKRTGDTEFITSATPFHNLISRHTTTMNPSNGNLQIARYGNDEFDL